MNNKLHRIILYLFSSLAGGSCFLLMITMIVCWTPGDVMGLGVSQSFSLGCKIVFCMALLIPVTILSVIKYKNIITKKQFLIYLSFPVGGSILGAALLFLIQVVAYLETYLQYR